VHIVQYISHSPKIAYSLVAFRLSINQTILIINPVNSKIINNVDNSLYKYIIISDTNKYTYYKLHKELSLIQFI